MGAVRARAWSLLRRRVAGTALLAALIGLAGAVSLAAVAGARRGDEALPRFLERQDPPTAVLYAFGTGPGDDMAEVAGILRGLPYVVEAARVAPLRTVGTDPDGSSRPLIAFDVIDPGAEGVLGRPIVVAGRLPAGSRADEVAVDEEFVDRAGVGVGEAYELSTYTAERSDDADPNGAPPDGPAVEVRVVGVVRYPQDLVPARLEQDSTAVDHADIYLTPAFWDRYGPDLATFFGVGVAVRLEGGTDDLGRFQDDVASRFEGASFVDAVDTGEGVAGIPLDGVRRAIDLEALALRGFGALAAVVGLVVVGQALVREVVGDAADDPVLHALGMTAGQRVAAVVLRAVVPAVGGAALAVAGAVALSPLTPVGVARRAEHGQGVDADLPVLAVGAGVALILVCAWAAVAGWRATTAATRPVRAGPQRASAVSRLLAGRRMPVAAWTGLTMAVQRGRGTATGLRRTTAVVAGLTVIVVVAAAAFMASLDALRTEPEAYGVTWDASVGEAGTPEQAVTFEARLRQDDDVEAFTGITGEGLTVGNLDEVPALVVFEGPVGPRVVEGRAPRGPDEIAFAGRTMEDLGLDVGDRVDVAIDRSASLQVTGEVVLNGAGLLDDLDSGEGAVLPDPAQQRLVGAEERDLSFPGAYLVRLDPAADREAVLARMEREHPHTVARPLTPSQIDNLDPVAGLPALLAGLVAVLGTATVAHATATTVRRRRRDLAMLSGLGFVRRQVSGALAWQATAVALPGLLLGVPLGVAVGRWSWRLTADALWVVSPPRVPLVALGVVAVAAVVVVNAAALGAGVVGWRRSPAVALRAE